MAIGQTNANVCVCGCVQKHAVCCHLGEHHFRKEKKNCWGINKCKEFAEKSSTLPGCCQVAVKSTLLGEAGGEGIGL